MSNKKLQIAIDGPAAAGKSTTGKEVAKELHYSYIDTGAMYRCVTLKALRTNVPLDSNPKLSQMINQTKITFRPGNPKQRVILDGHDVTNQIRDKKVTDHASQVAAQPDVRKKLTKLQRSLAQKGGVVMDGRDIGTTVLPHADVKIFMTADVRIRAQRRFHDNQSLGIHVPLKQLVQEIKIRDYKDSHRAISPLKMAKDAIKLDSSHQTIKQSAHAIIKIAQQA